MNASPHIYTLTGNLLAERTLEFKTWETGRTQRAGRESFHTRGKGVNVSNMLTRLGVPNTALIFTGGAPGAECEAWLQQRGIAYRAFATRAPSRTGTVIWSEAQAETTFLGPDVAPDTAAIAAGAAYLDSLPDGQVLVLCGSFPGWNEAGFDPLRAALTRWQQRGLLVADAYGPPLIWLARLPLALVKINRTEFDALAPHPRSDVTLRESLRLACQASPVRNWIVTQGPNSIWLAPRDGELLEFHPATLREVSPTGSGDVFLACLLQAHFQHGQTLAEAVRHAMPYAAANAAHPGVADFALPLPR
jgi:fructose-1-phosphate kinase PfkB-like protein